MTELQVQPSPRSLGWSPVIEALREVIEEKASSPVYLVGGVVRDAFLNRPIHDIDMATAADGRKLAKIIADKFNGAYYPLDADRGVGRAIITFMAQQFVIDIAQFRGANLSDDLAGRDFTINAMAVPIEGEMQSLIDPTGGLRDLNDKLLRRCSVSALTDDPVRTLRAIRQSVALNFRIEPDTRADIRREGQNISNISPERVRDEFMKMLGGPRPHVSLRTLDALGLLGLIVPEMEIMKGVTQTTPHVHDVWEHTLAVVERVYGVLMTISPARTEDSAADAAYGMVVYLLDRFRKQLQSHLNEALPNERSLQALLILGALLHDSGKPATRTVGDDARVHFYQHEIVGAQLAEDRGVALRLSNDETSRLSDMVRHHMRTMQLNMQGNVELSRRTVHRFWKSTGKVGVDVCILSLADYLGMVGVNFILQDWIHFLQMIGALLDGYFNQHGAVVAPPPLVTGHDLITTLALLPGPEIGQILAAINEAQAAGEITTQSEALTLARSMLGTQGRSEN
jgi:poly(A) polymerase